MRSKVHCYYCIYQVDGDKCPTCVAWSNYVNEKYLIKAIKVLEGER